MTENYLVSLIVFFVAVFIIGTMSIMANNKKHEMIGREITEWNKNEGAWFIMNQKAEREAEIQYQRYLAGDRSGYPSEQSIKDRIAEIEAEIERRKETEKKQLTGGKND